MLARDLKYVSDSDFDKLNCMTISLGKKLLGFIKYVENNVA